MKGVSKLRMEGWPGLVIRMGKQEMCAKRWLETARKYWKICQEMGE
jgi:hypothetical protein